MVEPTIESCALSQGARQTLVRELGSTPVAENIAVRDSPSELRYELLLDLRCVPRPCLRCFTFAAVAVAAAAEGRDLAQPRRP